LIGGRCWSRWCVRARPSSGCQRAQVLLSPWTASPTAEVSAVLRATVNRAVLEWVAGPVDWRGRNAKLWAAVVLRSDALVDDVDCRSPTSVLASCPGRVRLRACS
jgi:hypothetical protein